MSLKERIKSLGEYFVTCNIGEGAICVVTKFPKTWIIPNEEYLQKEYQIILQKNQGLCYFMTEIENGEIELFLGIEHVIQSNKEIESKTELLKQKAKELSEIFEKEPLEKLKTITFVFEEKRKQRKTTKSKIEQEPIEEEIEKECIVSEEQQATTDDDSTMLNINNNEETKEGLILENTSLVDLAISLTK